MQKTMGNSLSHKINRRSTTKEERQLHVDNWKKSGLSMSEYCRQNNIALASLRPGPDPGKKVSNL
jgi:hypothetical protein